MIVCDGNYGLGAYVMDSVHNREPERSRVVAYGHAARVALREGYIIFMIVL